MHSEHHLMLLGLIGFCSLLLLFIVIRYYTRKSIMPADAWILVAGIIYGVVLRKFEITDLPRFELDPSVIILVFLPLLIFASGRLIHLQALQSESITIGFFAIFGVLATSFLIGAPIAWVLGIPLLHGLLIGAAAGATDPAAVAAIFHNFDIPERLGLTIEGESLFNDGTTVVLFGLISSLLLTDSSFNTVDSLLQFTWAIIVAIPLGAFLGWGGAKILRHWQEKNLFFEVSMTVVVTYSAFLLAEELLHVSGVIAVLLSAIFFIKTRTALSVTVSQSDAEKKVDLIKDNQESEYQKTTSDFWDTVSLVINGILFFSLGAATGLHDFSEVPTIAVIVAVLSLVIARCLLIFGGSLLLRGVQKNIPMAWQHIMVLGGLRGAVTAALILMVPFDYPHRGVFLCLAFAMIAFTLIVQPVLLKLYLNRASL